VNYTEDIFDALDLQDELQCKYTGGTVFHTFVGKKLSRDAVKAIVRKISNRYHLPYFTITPTFSICPIHGYLPGEHEYCPKCDEEQETYTPSDKKQEISNDVFFVTGNEPASEVEESTDEEVMIFTKINKGGENENKM
jgi:anaerobic ribonucleoside-triphosphate reductase